MRGRRIAFAGAALAVVLVGTFSTARASQMWNEQSARATMMRAEAQTTLRIRAVLHEGATPAQLAPLIARQHALDGSAPPHGSLFWDTNSLTFYKSAARSWYRLGQSVQRRAAALRVAARARAERGLARSKADIAAAAVYRLDSSRLLSVLQAQEMKLRTARTISDYLATARAISAARHPFHAALVARETAVKTILSRNGGNAGRVRSEIAGRVAAVQGRLSLLSLVSAAAVQMGTQLGALQQKANSEGDATQVAMTEMDVDVVLGRLESAWQTELPAKMVVVSTENQSATMYQNGAPVYSTPVTTGGPELPTDHGVFHIYFKVSPFVFHSPFPLGSPYYYPPTPVQYWMPFDGQEGLHDASWRSNFGPGSNLAPTDLGTGNYILGTHGCVNLPTDAAAWLWNWAPVGTTVVVI